VETQNYCYGCSINMTDFPVVKAHVDELSSARIWQHKLCATLPANININYRLSHQTILPYLYYYIYQNWNNSWKPYSVVSFNMGHYILYKGLFYPIMLKCLHYTTLSSCLSCTSCKLSHIMNNSTAIIM
jgi:hypothetical protein